MRADEALRAGQLGEALEDLQSQVRLDPANPKLRIFLFQLLAVRGDCARALTQLEVLRGMDDASLAMVAAYRDALQCEVLRADVMAGNRTPIVFGEPEEWIGYLVQSLHCQVDGDWAGAGRLRDAALEAAPDVGGELDGSPFEWIVDADSRLGPVLEAIVSGKYYWIPFARIAAIRFEPPSDLRDVVWMPTHFAWTNGGEAVGFVPTRYPLVEGMDDAARLARRTDWSEPAAGFFLGTGQRMLSTSGGEHPLMDIREIRLQSQGAAADTAPGQG